MAIFRRKEEYYYDDYDYLDDEPIVIETKEEKKSHKLIRKINILYIIVIIVMLMVTIDVVGVSRYNVGPFFAIKTHTYKDGGSKEYYGFLYKVIKYNEYNGRRDKVVGSWNLKYNVKPIEYNYVSLAINLENNPDETYNKIGNSYIKLTGRVSKVKDNKIIIKYHDDSMSKYNLDITCTMKTKKQVEKNTKITLVGTVYEFKLNNNKPNKLYIKNCLIK